MDNFSRQKRSKIMTAIKSKHTMPEKILRKALRLKGLKYKLHYGKEKADIALPARKIAIFVDGCFWHQCPKHGHLPKSNKKYWLPKLKKNIKRAKEKDKRLKKKGWKIMHIWEHELKNPKNALMAISKIKKKLG